MEPHFRINQQGSEGCEVIKAETHNKKQNQETVLTEHSKSLEEVENLKKNLNFFLTSQV